MKLINYHTRIFNLLKSSSLSLSLSLTSLFNNFRHKLFSRNTKNKSRLLSPVSLSPSVTTAFTIVELLVVIVVIAILATITIVSYTGITKKATAASLQSSVKEVASSIEVDYASTGAYPTTASAVNSGKGIPATSNVKYVYNITHSGTSYCLSASSTTQADLVYHYTPDDGQVKAGACATPKICPTGYIVVPGNSTFSTSDFCVMKYEAKNDGSGKAVSTAAGLPWVNISQTDAITTSTAACASCHLITDNEWLTIAHNVMNVASNWSGGAVGSGYLYSGHNDNVPANSLAASTDDDGYFSTGNSSPSNQRRTLTLSNGEVIWDLAGNVWEWTSGTFSGTFPTPADSWIEWNNSSLVLNNLSSTFKPSYSEPAAVASWTGAANGIGQLYTSSETGTSGLLRGGGWFDGASAGAFYLDLRNAPSFAGAPFGFRVVQG